MAKAKSVDEKYMGPEPAFSGPITSETQLGLALNWYNYFYTAADARPWLINYMKDKFTKEQISLFKRLPDWKIGITNCALARMTQRGAILPERVVKNMHNRILQQIEYAKQLQEVKEEVAKPRVVVSIQDRVKEKAWAIIADIEEELDQFFESDYTPRKFSTYDLLKKREAKTAQSKIITDYFTTILEELQGAIDKTDEQLVEAYERLGKKKLTNYRDFIKMIVEDCNRYFGNQVIVRKPRKKKEKSATQLLKSFSYKKEDNENKLVSADPINIIGAQSVWLYNVKYKKLTVLHAYGHAGLSVKGTTIINFDDKTSVTKTLRKPEEVLPKVLTGGKVVLKKLMSDIKTKESPALGRTNADTIIVKCVK